jgi:hypothetical protein
VHGVCDVTHTQELFRALERSCARAGIATGHVRRRPPLRALIQTIVAGN